MATDQPPAPLSLATLSDGPEIGDVLCRLDDIPDGKARTFTWKKGTWLFEIFIQRMGDDIFAYENTCPHVGLPLNLRPDHFLDRDGQALFCMNHAAFFTIDAGLCIKGPCKGKYLFPIALDLIDGDIIVA